MHNLFDLPGSLFQLTEGFLETLLSSTLLLLWLQKGVGFGRLLGELREWGQEQGRETARFDFLFFSPCVMLASTGTSSLLVHFIYC